MNKQRDEKVIPEAEGKQTSKADFDRNRDGLYGGLPKARDPEAAGPRTNQPHPQRDPAARRREGEPRHK